jgi:hypothetical protein
LEAVALDLLALILMTTQLDLLEAIPILLVLFLRVVEEVVAMAQVEVQRCPLEEDQEAVPLTHRLVGLGLLVKVMMEVAATPLQGEAAVELVPLVRMQVQTQLELEGMD